MSGVTYRICIESRWEASHQITGLPPGSPQGRVHGHSYRSEVILVGKELDESGSLVDTEVVTAVTGQLDHKHLNDVLTTNPTAENVVKFITTEVLASLFRSGLGSEVRVERVRVWETPGCWAEVELDTREV
jgi:6-pyruvoyltetrahydropterin/6-carboxytetrahydropterin synthase